jgi:RES domain-containing protein
MAQRLVAAGSADVIVPSFAAGAVAADNNVVFWDWTPQKPHQVRVIDDEHRLPRDASSWR